MKEKEIKQLIRSSPDDGYRQLFEQYHAYALAVIYRTLSGKVSSKEAEDCVVDVFADVIMHCDTSSDGNIQAYIGAAARNRAITLKRAKAASEWYTVPEEAAGDVPDCGTDVEKAAENSETLRLVLAKIDELDEPDPTIIIQKYFFGRSSAEIADIVGMSPAAVRVRLSRALKRLRTVLEELGVTL
ncbi:MAG: sigma-70 family RNA polymerase sigma factor [Ruminococcus sp.]|nr:sigma-70 family RNA polymerase sigma factor [Ruminococcus sp.]